MLLEKARPGTAAVGESERSVRQNATLQLLQRVVTIDIGVTFLIPPWQNRHFVDLADAVT